MVNVHFTYVCEFNRPLKRHEVVAEKISFRRERQFERKEKSEKNKEITLKDRINIGILKEIHH